MEQKRKCKCCGEMTIDEDDMFDICDNCGWESDPIQEENPDYKGGANQMSLNEAKEAYKQHRRVY